MRRVRVPTIPNMGLSSSPKEREPLQTCDNAIFADAEEEYPRLECRPTAPHMSGLRRRSANREEGRYEDAHYDENPLEKRPSTKMRTLTSFASLGGVRTSVEKSVDTTNTEEDKMQIQNQEEQAVSEVERNNGSFIRREAASTPAKAGPSGHLDTSHPTRRYSSHNVDTRRQERVLWNELKQRMRKVNETANRIRNRLLHDTAPVFKRNARAGLLFLVANVSALFSFLKWACLTFVQFLDSYKAKTLQNGERAIEVFSSGDPSEEKRKDTQMSVIEPSTTEMQNEKEEVSSSRTFLKSCNTALEPQKQGERISELCSSDDRSEENRKSAEMVVSDQLTTEMHNETKKGSPSRIFLTSCNVAPEPQNQRDAAVHDKRMWTPGPRMTEESITAMTTVPRPPLTHHATEYVLEDQESEEHPDNKTKIAPSILNVDSGPRDDSRTLNEMSSNAESRPDGSGAPPSTENQSQGGNLAEDLMSQLDQSSMRLEHRESEIILSPLDSTTPTFALDGEFDVEDMKRANYLRGGTGIAERPGRLSTEMNQLIRLPGRMRSSRGPTGKLKSDVRTMKDSLFRVFGRNKIEPETRFASPRSARKTLALVADMLVKEHGCDVAVRRNGALKMRCEKIFSGSQKLRVRLAFQSMDAFSCNVIVCRSREDDLQVSTTDYVSFVADLQRTFLNATSEGMHGTYND